MLSKLRARAREAAKAMGARRKDRSVKNEPPSTDQGQGCRGLAGRPLPETSTFDVKSVGKGLQRRSPEAGLWFQKR